MKKLFRSLLIPIIAPLGIIPCVVACNDNNTQPSETFDITNGVQMDFEPLATNELVSFCTAKTRLKQLHDNNPEYFRQEILNGLYQKVHKCFSFQGTQGWKSQIDSFVVTINHLSLEEAPMMNKCDGPAHMELGLSFDINIHLVVSFDWNKTTGPADVRNTYEIDSIVKYDKVYFDFASDQAWNANWRYAFGPRDGVKYGEAPYPVGMQPVMSNTIVHKNQKNIVSGTILADTTQTFSYDLPTFYYADNLNVFDERNYLENGLFGSFNSSTSDKDMEFFAKFLTKFDNDTYYLNNKAILTSLINGGTEDHHVVLNMGTNASLWIVIYLNGLYSTQQVYNFKPTKLRLDEDSDLVFKEKDPVNPLRPRHVVVGKHDEFGFPWEAWNWNVPPGEGATNEALLLDQNGNPAPYTEQELQEYPSNTVFYLSNYATLRIVIEFTDAEGNKIESPSIIWGRNAKYEVFLPS